jgi:hypothetical protein
MRPSSVYAKHACPAGDSCDLLRLLQGPHRVGYRLIMVLRSQQDWSATRIAELLGCDPRTVRRWVQRYNQQGAGGLADRPRVGRPRLGSRRLGARIRRLLEQPKAWTIPLLYLSLGRPAMSLRTLHRRVREVANWRRPRLVAKGDPDRDQTLVDLHRQLRDLPAGAVVLAEDETHVNLLPWVRASWIPHGSRQPVMTPGTNRRRTIFGAVDLQSGRWLYQVTRKAVSVAFTAFLNQVLAAYPTAPKIAVVCDNVIIHHSKIVQRWLATHPRILVLHGARTARMTTRSSASGERSRPPWPTARPDHRRAHPPGPRLLPAAYQRADPGHRRAAQLTLAPRQLPTEPQAGRLGSRILLATEDVPRCHSSPTRSTTRTSKPSRPSSLEAEALRWRQTGPPCRRQASASSARSQVRSGDFEVT